MMYMAVEPDLKERRVDSPVVPGRKIHRTQKLFSVILTACLSVPSISCPVSRFAIQILLEGR
jgi:hypothetical protein